MEFFMKWFYATLTLILIIWGCSHQKPLSQQPPVQLFVKDGQYDSEFPQKPASPYLDRLAQSVKLISSMVFYKAYQFNFKDYVTKDQIHDPNLLNRSTVQYIYQRPSSGTATLISQKGRELIFLTCSHIVKHPDTVFTYYSRQEKPREMSPFIHSVSFKIKQTYNIIGLPKAHQPILLAHQEETDLALIGVKLLQIPQKSLPVLEVPFGRAAELHWGTFIYLLAYPQGKLMLSHSVVSQPNRDQSHNFLFNSSLTRGISGGIVLAIRDGIPNFEIVGIASALGAQTQFYLRPDLNKALWMFDTNLPYKGDIFIDQQVGNNSGIVFAVSAENIIAFLKKNRQNIESKGFQFPSELIRTAH